MVSEKPLYRMEDWLHDYLDGIIKERFEAAKYNDDRLGRNLDLLFIADLSSFMTELSANAIRVHQLETETLHNGSTSIAFIGAYNGVDPEAVKIMHGYNKDHRPDCKQIVFGLNITADGHVPISYQLYDGNQADVTTHIPNWEQLREMLGKEDFIYVADSKLCSYANPCVIDENGGLFITVVPRNFHGVQLATIEQSGRTIHTALKGLSALRRKILTLLKVPIEIYTRLRDRWWEYALE